MRDIAADVARWLAEGKGVAIAVVTRTWGSSPRPVGSMMAVSDDGSISGSVSGGCVEGAVIEAAHRALSSGIGESLRFEQLDPEDVWSVGLSCGGRIEVVVSPWKGAWGDALELALGGVAFNLAITQQGSTLLPLSANDGGSDRSVSAALEGEGTFLYEHRRPDQLVVIGGVHIAVPLISIAKTLGFQTTLIEPRPAFAEEVRFPVPPDEILVSWPNQALEQVHLDGSTFAVLLTHDPKIDDEALRVLLKSDVRYIGALGSRTTQAQRRARLLDEGFSEAEVSRIHGPVGLDIGARTPEEIALSIMAEIVKVRRSLPPAGREG